MNQPKDSHISPDKSIPGSREFTIYPAIDLIGGKCVRLSQGDYNRVKVYSDDPVQVAMSFAQAGAKWIHIVDLDAARTGIPTNHQVIANIARKTELKVQMGGGIRNMDYLNRIFELAVSRGILGTSAVKDRAFTLEAIRRFGDRIIIGIDARDGKIAVDGWTSESEWNVVDFAVTMQEAGASTVIYTDIARDGMFRGTHTEGINALAASTSLEIIASGGVADISDVIAAKEAGACGVIIGKALYEGKVDLKQCLQNV